MLPEIYSIDLSANKRFVDDAVKRLQPYLPYCLPVYRRLQDRSFSPNTKLITSLIIDFTIYKEYRNSYDNNGFTLPQEDDGADWLMAVSEPNRAPETQIFFFATWESSRKGNLRRPSLSGANLTLLRSWLVHLRDSGAYRPAALSGEVQSRIPRQIRGRHIVLSGSIHSSTALALAHLGVISFDLELGPSSHAPDGTRLPERYKKWVFDLRKSTDRRKLIDLLDKTQGIEHLVGDPDGGAGDIRFRWHKVRRRDFALVRSRTKIPRQDSTLEQLTSVALYPRATGPLAEQHEVNDKEDIKPVAWAFLGLDGSLTSLHVEEEYRGLGLAKTVASKLLGTLPWLTMRNTIVSAAELMEDFWGHADVAEDNAASNGVCRSLGGRIMWDDFWIRLDLDKVDW